jgi:tRNA(Ile)-lysidine synthase
MKAPPAPAIEALLSWVRDAIAALATKSSSAAERRRVAVALSGGRDSMALLDALALMGAELEVILSAVHVHHGLSPNADSWAAFCADECAKRGVPLTVCRVSVRRAGGMSLEAAARAARYAAFAKLDVDAIALAHHADDQAETLLLQLLRGAGPRGLAAMPLHRDARCGPSLLRPFLALSGAAIDAYAKARDVAWITDESNANTSVKRNYIRHEIAPRLSRAFPGYPGTLARSATHLAEASLLIDELAAIDARASITGDPTNGMTLERAKLIELGHAAPHRARNLLRWFLAGNGLRSPSTARLAEMLHQLTHAKSDARVRIAHEGTDLGIHRGRIFVHPPRPPAYEITLHGEHRVTLPHGTLELTPCIGAGIGADAFRAGAVTVRNRQGGERIQLAANRPRQALKRLLQGSGVPLWERDSLPLVFCGPVLACVPGIGVDIAFQTAAGAPGFEVSWLPTMPETLSR